VEFIDAARWTDPAQDQARIAAARRYGTAVEPFASGVYVNDLTDEENRRPAAVPTGTLTRLAALKDRYDPGNLFHLTTTATPQGAATVIARICPATFEQARMPNQTHDRGSTT
jgi:hypothetical protein